jgi:hypothetical protein
MATRGGLEIHMELAHGSGEPTAVAAIAPQPIPALPQGGVPHRPINSPRAPAAEWQLPAFVRGVDPTMPLTALLVLALFVAGIGAALHRGSAGSPTVAGAQATTAALGAQAVTVDTAADQKLAQSLVLTPTDYPDGWTFAPYQSSPADAADHRADAACLGLPDPAATQTANVTGVVGQQAGALQTSTGVVVYRSEQQAVNEVAAEGGPAGVGCAKQQLTRALARVGIVVTDVGVGRFAISTGNVRSVALHAEVAMSKGPARGVMAVDAVFLQHGRVEGGALFMSFAGPYPIDTEQTLVTRFAHRLAGA